MTHIDNIFRNYAIAFFGLEAVEECFSDAAIEEARCFAFKELAAITAMYGKQESGTARELFINYLFEHFV